MAQHTQAPWTYDSQGEVVGGDSFTVAQVEYVERLGEEVEANGRVLAAAPQLLAGCLAALAYLENTGAPQESAGAELIAALRNLVALAEGEVREENAPIILTLTEYARRTVDAIGRSGESDEATINRILDTLCASSSDFDHFYGEPRDGRGPSGV